LNFGEDEYDRFNFTANVSTQATDWLKLEAIARYSNEKKNFPSGGFGGYHKDIIYHQMSRSSPVTHYIVQMVV